MKKTLIVRIDTDLYETLKLLALKNRSTISEETRRIIYNGIKKVIKNEKA